MSLQETLDALVPQIEADLQQVTRTPYPGLDTYYSMMHYHLGWVDQDLHPVQANSGKRLRPILCLLSCQALGGSLQQALPAASAVELIHNFSLVHDDIQDASPTRRGRRAVWDIWGIAHGINVGDGLFVLARLALHRLADRGLSIHRQQAAALALDWACLALCEGQHFDMTFQNHLDVDLDQYLWMIHHKTASLLASATQLGAVIATDDTKLIEHYFRFGENLGMAFQIQDDVLGIWGDERVTGKSAATDIRDKKKTLPVIYALSQADDRDTAEQLADLYARPGPLDHSAIEAVLSILDRVGARQYAEEMAKSYHRLAFENLEQTGIENATQSSLQELAAFLLGRQT